MRENLKFIQIKHREEEEEKEREDVISNEHKD